jgi:hypothetical protein
MPVQYQELRHKRQKDKAVSSVQAAGDSLTLRSQKHLMMTRLPAICLEVSFGVVRSAY